MLVFKFETTGHGFARVLNKWIISKIRRVFSRGHRRVFLLVMLKLSYLGKPYHKYNYENKEEEVRDTARQENFPRILP